MLPPLLYLSALSLLAGAAAQQSVNESTVLNISSCPITFYGQKYEEIYITIQTSVFVVCFDGYIDPEGTGDCIVGTQNMNGEALFSINSGDANSEATFRQGLPTITNNQECTVNFLFQTGGQDALLVLGNFGTQAAVYLRVNTIGTVLFYTLVHGKEVEWLNVTNTPLSQQYTDFLDVSACRVSDVVYLPGTFVSSDPNTCSNLTCDQHAALITTGCGPSESCQGNNICMRDTSITCTVTGPTVINFEGQVNSVEDRCAYPLLETLLVPDFLLLANFQERRRKDVSFLDSVTIVLGTPAVFIHLEQGSEVLLNDAVLSLNHSAQVIHGIKLSKGENGVTAVLSLSNYTASIFFDGYTAQIHLQGPSGENLSPDGLCGNSSKSLSEQRLSDFSAPGCETEYTDSPDSTINCTLATEHCHLLKEAPFTSCNSVVDPEPYIAACIDTMCKYPAVDELSCQFLNAYDRACSLQNSDITDNWRSKSGCSSHAFCEHNTCLDHEFCAQRFVGGDTGCFCRAIFASKYTSIDALGDPTVCGPNSASLTLVGCLLVENGIDYSTLHLNDPTCSGQMDEQTHMVTFSFNNSNTCGTVVTANGSQIIYDNSIVTQNISSDMITRHDKVRIDFSCVHTQPDVETMSFRIKDSSVTMQITSESWNYNVTMKAYIDPTLTEVLDSDTEVQLNQRVWVELDTEGLEGSLVSVVTDSCWATHEPLANESLKHDLIMNGCPNPADATVNVRGNGVGTSNYFSFNMFQFAGFPGDIYLHCKVDLCITETNNCVPVCPHRHDRRRRAARAKYEGEAAALLTMAWFN